MRGVGAGWLALLAVTSSLRADEAALTVADLAAYRAALSSGEGSARDATPPAAVGFRELWDHPEAYRGRRVDVQGRLVRRFRQGSFGAFPPLEEAWIYSAPAGNPFCLVFPATPKTTAAGQVRFVGTFLKLVEYQGGDGPRLAPLIVGPAPPAAAVVATERGSRPADVPATGLTGLGGTVVLMAALLVALVLARQHLRRPLRRTRHENAGREPAPLFDDAPGPTSSEP